MTRVFVLLCLLIPPGWAASETPVVRVEVNPDDVIVGESIRLRVTVLVPTWFTRPSVYPSFELANTITRLPPDSSFNTSVDVDGERWTGITRDYRIVPQIAAAFELNDTAMQVHYADPDTRQSTGVQVPVPPIRFRATVPAGTESLDPFLTGSNGRVQRSIAGDLDGIAPGDALVMTVTATLNGVPAMFLPQLISGMDAPGVTAYPKEPVVTDGEQAVRTETVTYVFQSAGDFVFPAVTLRWWNPTHRRIASAVADPLTVSVTGLPVSATSREAEQPSLPGWLLAAAALAGVAALYGLMFCVRWASPRVRSALAARRARTLASERQAFEQLSEAVRSRDIHTLSRHVDLWLSRLPNRPTLADVDAASGEPVEALVRALHEAHFGATPRDDHADFAALAAALPSARRAWRRTTHRSPQTLLTPLNPGAPANG